MPNTLSLREKFPGFATSYIVDKRGLGYRATDITKRLSYDPEYLDALASYYLSKPIPQLDPSVWVEIINQTCDVRSNFIRGNSVPVEVLLATLWTTALSTLTKQGFSDDEAELLTPIVVNALRQTGLYTVAQGEIIQVYYEVSNTIYPLAGYASSNALIGRIAFASALAAELKTFHDNVKASQTEVSERRSWVVSQTTQVLSNKWTHAVSAISVAKLVVLEGVAAVNRTMQWALRNDDFMPLHLTTEDLAYLFSFGNSILGAITNDDAILGGAPSMEQEVRAKQFIERFRKAISATGCLFEIRPVQELTKLLSQYQVSLSGESDVRSLHATEWYYPRSLSVNAAYQPPYAGREAGVYFVRPSSAAAKPVNDLASPLNAIAKKMDDRWFRTSHSQVLGGECFMNYLTSDLCPYEDDFANAVLRILAASLARSVRCDTTMIYEVAGWDDYPIAPASSSEPRAIYETDPARALCQLPLGGEGTVTAFKNASLYSLCPSNSLARFSDNLAIPRTAVGIPVNADTHKPSLLQAPCAAVQLQSLDGTKLELSLPLYAWLKLPDDVAVEMYIERTLTCEMADGQLSVQLVQLTNVPITGPNSSHYARTLKLDLFRDVLAIATRCCGQLAQQIQANYTGWMPVFYFEQGADLAARELNATGALELYVALLRQFGFSCADALESFINHCIDNFTVDELLSNKVG